MKFILIVLIHLLGGIVIVLVAMPGSGYFFRGVDSRLTLSPKESLWLELSALDRETFDIDPIARSERVALVRASQRSSMQRNDPTASSFIGDSPFHGENSEVTHQAPSDMHHQGSYTHRAESNKHYSESYTHYVETWNHNIWSHCHVPFTQDVDPPPGVHSENTDTHTPTSDTHSVPTNTHFSNTDTHVVISDTHSSATNRHLIPSDQHSVLSDTTYQNGDVHFSSSETHFSNSASHTGSSDLHAGSSASSNSEDGSTISFGGCQYPLPNTGVVNALGVDYIESWDPIDLFEVLSFEGRIDTFDNEGPTQLTGEISVRLLDGDSEIVYWRLDANSSKSVGDKVGWGAFSHYGCGVHSWHRAEFDVTFIPRKPGYAVLEVSLDPLPDLNGDGGPAIVSVIYVRVPEWREYDFRYKTFIECKAIATPPYDPVARGAKGDDRVFDLDAGLNFSSAANLASRSALKASMSLDPAFDSFGGLGGFNSLWGESTGYLTPLAFIGGASYFCQFEPTPGSPTITGTLAPTSQNLWFSSEGLIPDTIYPGHPGIRVRKFKYFMSGGNPLYPPAAPNIDAGVTLYIRECAGNAWYFIEGEADNFPWHESYLNGEDIFTRIPPSIPFPDGLFSKSDLPTQTSWIPLD